ncbi:ribosomal protein S24, partial [Acrasis kona]
MPAADTSKATIRTRKFLTNRLLNRRQFSVDILHPGKQSLTRDELKERVAKMYKVSDLNTIFLFGFRTQFGGGKSTGFGLIYDTVQDAKRVEPRFRLIRQKLLTKVEKSRKQIKERKNRAKKHRGAEKTKVLYKDTG